MSSQLSCFSSTIHSLDQMNLTKTRFLPYQWRSYHSMKNKVRLNNSYTSFLFTNKHLLYLQKSTTTRMYSSRMRTARSSSRPSGGGFSTRRPPPRGQNSWHTLLKILPCPKLRLRAVTSPLITLGVVEIFFIGWFGSLNINCCTSFCPHSSTSFEFAYTGFFPYNAIGSLWSLMHFRRHVEQFETISDLSDHLQMILVSSTVMEFACPVGLIDFSASRDVKSISSKKWSHVSYVCMLPIVARNNDTWQLWIYFEMPTGLKPPISCTWLTIVRTQYHAAIEGGNGFNTVW